MDHGRPIEAMIPGVQGAVLGVLARTDDSLTMRTVARLAGASPNRTVSVLNQLITLGVVQRRDVGTAALVTLSRENEAARAILALADVRNRVLRRLGDAAQQIQPSPHALVVFGSVASGQAGASSDLDVLAVRAAGVPEGDDGWSDSLGRWADQAARISGNPVNLLHVGAEELARLITHPGSVWQSIARDGIGLVGSIEAPA